MNDKKIIFEREYINFLERRRSTEPFDDEEEPQKVVMSSVGLLSVSDKAHPLAMTEFYKATTNFPMTRKILNIINTCPGVEYITYLSRYTFTVGIGQLFTWEEVKTELEHRILGLHQQTMMIKSIADKELRAKVTAKREELKETQQNWAMLVLPNGSIEHITCGEDELEYSNNYAKLSHAQSIAGGLLLNSNKNSTL